MARLEGSLAQSAANNSRSRTATTRTSTSSTGATLSPSTTASTARSSSAQSRWNVSFSVSFFCQGLRLHPGLYKLCCCRCLWAIQNKRLQVSLTKNRSSNEKFFRNLDAFLCVNTQPIIEASSRVSMIISRWRTMIISMVAR